MTSGAITEAARAILWRRVPGGPLRLDDEGAELQFGYNATMLVRGRGDGHPVSPALAVTTPPQARQC